ncbi:hypothetical protein [Streptomyces sp. LN699]|uniref:hypothetical protein n=1 Tax=Streptomyces sp. LN699 TaxID=3112981 RepID=UPI003722F2BB
MSTASNPAPTAGNACLTLFVGLMSLITVFTLISSCGAEDPEPTPGKQSQQASDDSGGPLPSSEYVVAGEFTKWPFTVPSGTLECREGLFVTFEYAGTEWGINGSAQTRGYPFPDRIWAEDPNLGHGLKISMDEVLKRGLAMC